MTTTRCFLTLVLLTTACSKKDAAPAGEAKVEPASAKAEAPAAAPAAADPAGAAAWLKLPAFKLQLEAPGGSTAQDQSEGTLKQFGISAGTAMFSVGIVPPDLKLTYDQAVTSGNSNGTKVTTKEKFADGFHVESTTEGGSIQVEVRRTIAGTDYTCGTVAPDADTAKVVRAACLSLKAL